MLVEVTRKGFLAALVPVIVNAILAEHQVIVDIVAFISKGDFPRSRLGEKQRGKILATWVTRKMHTIAQFAIRDSSDLSDAQITEVAEPVSRLTSVRQDGSSMPASASSLRQVERSSSIDDQPAELSDVSHHARRLSYVPLPTGISEMPANYPPSLPDENELSNNETPTDIHANPYHFELPAIGTYDGSTPPPPVNRATKPQGHTEYDTTDPIQDRHYQTSYYPPEPPTWPSSLAPPAVPPKLLTHDSTTTIRANDTPLPMLQGTLSQPYDPRNRRQSTYLPSVSGHETLAQAEASTSHAPLSSSASSHSPLSGGGLRIANADPPSSSSSSSMSSSTDAHQRDWPHDSIMHMNLASNSRDSHYGGIDSGSVRPTSKKDSRGAKLGMHVYGQAVRDGSSGSGSSGIGIPPMVPEKETR